jgi:hypothetical protein
MFFEAAAPTLSALTHPRQKIMHETAFLPKQLLLRLQCNMSSFWVDVCKESFKKPLQELLDSTYGSCGVTVTCAAAAASACCLVKLLTVCDHFLRRLLRIA